MLSIMVGVRRFMSPAGRLSWVAGVVLRFRCTVNMVYSGRHFGRQGRHGSQWKSRGEGTGRTPGTGRRWVGTKRTMVALQRWVACLMTHFPGGL